MLLPALLPALFLTVWTAFIILLAARGYRMVDRWWEFKRWGRQPGYEYHGNGTPASFPVDLLGDLVFFVHVHNCVQWTADDIRHVVFDLELPGWSRSRSWRTVVAVEGRIEPDRPWPFAEEATALQGSGWVVLTPRRKAMDRKIWMWRTLDRIPPREQLLEPDVIFDLWQKIDSVAKRLRSR